MIGIFSVSKHPRAHKKVGYIQPEKQMASLHPNIHLFIPVGSLCLHGLCTCQNKPAFLVAKKDGFAFIFQHKFQRDTGKREVLGGTTFWQYAIIKKRQKPQTEEQRASLLPMHNHRWKGMDDGSGSSRLHAEQTVQLPRSTGTTKYWRVCMQLLHQFLAFPEFLASTDKDGWTFSDVTVNNNLALNYLRCDHIWTSWHSGESTPSASIAKWVIN